MDTTEEKTAIPEPKKVKTVLVTGGTGYIGAHTCKILLERGYRVRLAVRDRSKTGKYRVLSEIAEKSQGELEVYEANLLEAGSYHGPAEGADAIMHIASPFTLRFKNAQKELIEPAVQGTRNVLESANASSTVKKVVLTSSVAAVHGDTIDMQEQGLKEFTEAHWNTSSSASHQPYSYSKVSAEKEAWKIHDAQQQWKLVAINPSFVMGPALDTGSDSESLNFMRDMLSGKFAMGAPDLHFGYVDVRDVALAHVYALESSDAEGRHILAERTGSVLQLCDILRKQYGDRFKLPKKTAPKWLLYLVGWTMGVSAKFVKRNVGYPIRLNTEKSRKQLGLKYTPLEQSLKDMVEAMQL